MQNEVRDAILEGRLLRKGDRCILAVSGGADSMGLLHVLIRLNGVLKVKYRVVHVHHGLRGAEADRDATFVKSVCARYQIPCKVIPVNVRDFAEQHKLSIEEAARYLRYQALETAAQRWEQEEDTDRPVKIAVAHNKEDNAETILMQLCRGSGLRGVSGMAPVRGRLIRPLLTIHREDIEKYLLKEEESWITDATNEENEYTRNRMRHDILPLLISEVNTGSVENITRAGRMIGEADRYLASAAEALASEHFSWDGTAATFPVAVMKQQAHILRMYLIRLLLGKVNRSMKNITFRHVEDIENLLDAPTGKHVDLPYRLVAERGYEDLRVYRREIPMNPETAEEKKDWGHFVFRTFPYRGERVPEDEGTKWFDYDRIDGLIETRYRKDGDYLDLKGVGKKALRTYMTDVKIPKEQRDEIPVVAVGSHVMWLVGHRISEAYKIGPETKRVMEIKFEEGE